MKKKTEEHFDLLFTRYPALEEQRETIRAAFCLLADCYRAGGKLLVCGNGGSCADCDHIVGELCKGFLSLRPLGDADRAAFAAVPGMNDTDLALLTGKLQGGLPAVSLPSQTALVSAFCNDVDASLVYAQLVWAMGKPGDLLWCLSTSGNSRNVVLAAEAARARGMRVLSLVGAKSCRLDPLSDVIVHAPSSDTYRVQEYHLPIYHWLCAGAEAYFFNGKE